MDISNNSSSFYSCLSIRDHFDEVLPFLSILSSCIATVCWLLCKSCNSICPSEFLPASASFSLHYTKHYQFLQIVSFTPGNVTKILQFLFYNCIKESGFFSNFKQDTLVGPFGCPGDAQKLSPTPHLKSFNFSSICSIDRPGFTCICCNWKN